MREARAKDQIGQIGSGPQIREASRARPANPGLAPTHVRSVTDARCTPLHHHPTQPHPQLTALIPWAGHTTHPTQPHLQAQLTGPNPGAHPCTTTPPSHTFRRSWLRKMTVQPCREALPAIFRRAALISRAWAPTVTCGAAAAAAGAGGRGTKGLGVVCRAVCSAACARPSGAASGADPVRPCAQM